MLHEIVEILYFCPHEELVRVGEELPVQRANLQATEVRALQQDVGVDELRLGLSAEQEEVDQQPDAQIFEIVGLGVGGGLGAQLRLLGLDLFLERVLGGFLGVLDWNAVEPMDFVLLLHLDEGFEVLLCAYGLMWGGTLEGSAMIRKKKL